MGLVKKHLKQTNHPFSTLFCKDLSKPMNQKQGVSPKETDPENQNQNQEQ